MLEAIRSKRSVMVLLGAGASFGLAPQVSDVTCHLMHWSPPHRGGGKPFFAPFATLAASSSYQINFEDLIDLLDTIASWNWSGNQGYQFSPTLWMMNRLFSPKRSIKALRLNGGELRLMAYQARAEVLRYICQHTKPPSILSHAPINRLLRALHDCLGFPLAIASVNYDAVVEYSTLPLANGFRLPVRPGILQFDPTFEWEPYSPHRVLYLPLHGSVHFAPSDAIWGENPLPTVFAPLQPVWVCSLEEADQLRAKTLPAYVAQREWQIEPVMVTGRNKLNNILTYPYGAYMSLFRRLAFEADIWILVGYGGNDPDINSILGQALYTRVGMRKTPFIIVCNQCDAHGLDRLLANMWTLSGISVTLHESRRPPLWYELTVHQQDASVGLAWVLGVESLPIAELLDVLVRTG